MNYLVFTHGGGRFGNQLITYSHLLAFAAEFQQNIRVVDIAFWPYQTHLNSLTQNPYCLLPNSTANLGASWIRELLKPDSKYVNSSARVHHLHFWANRMPRCQSVYVPQYDERSDYFDLIDPNFFASLKQNYITCLAGWPVRQWKLFERHEKRIREAITFPENIRQIADEFISELRERHDVLIGLLIRQDDYVKFADGYFHLSTRDYVKAAEFFLADLPHQSPGVIVASDTIQEPNELERLPYYFTTGAAGQNGHYLESLAQLAQCDFILSVPSTFAAWAAFLGNTPVAVLSSEQTRRSQIDLIEGSFSKFRSDSLMQQAVI